MSTPTRTFRGRVIDELIPKIQAELGAEAIIVRRRDGLTGGILGFFQHPFVEIEAMAGGPSIDIYDEAGVGAEVEYGQGPSSPPALPGVYRHSPAPPPLRAQGPLHDEPLAPPARVQDASRFYASAPTGPPDYGSANVTAHLAALARADRASAGLRPPGRERNRAVAAPGVDFEELVPRAPAPPPRSRLAPEYATAPAYAPPASPAPRAAAAAGEQRTVAAGSGARARAGVERNLQRVGVSAALARELIDGALAHTHALAPRAGLAQAVRTTLAQHIPVAPPLPAQGAAIVVVGAGGAGKTTCCATLLAAYRANSTLKASFATLTRGSPGGELEMILSPQLMKPAPVSSPRAQRALRLARLAGLLVLDTPRLSPVEKSGIREMTRLLAELRPERVVVALPATLGATAAAQLLEALRPLGANALAVTHADETDQLGVAIEAACAFDLAPELMLDRARSGGWRLTRTDPAALVSRLMP